MSHFRFPRPECKIWPISEFLNRVKDRIFKYLNTLAQWILPSEYSTDISFALKPCEMSEMVSIHFGFHTPSARSDRYLNRVKDRIFKYLKYSCTMILPSESNKALVLQFKLWEKVRQWPLWVSSQIWLSSYRLYNTYFFIRRWATTWGEAVGQKRQVWTCAHILFWHQ